MKNMRRFFLIVLVIFSLIYSLPIHSQVILISIFLEVKHKSRIRFNSLLTGNMTCCGRHSLLVAFQRSESGFL
jgi:hypothetical protein